MNCHECGAVAPEDDLFCGECGAVLLDSVPDKVPSGPVGASGAPVQRPTQASSPAERSTRANTAFVLGFISIGLSIVACIPLVTVVSCMGPLVGIAAIVVGALAKRDLAAQGGSDQDRKKAQQGMIMGVVGTLLYFVVMTVTVVIGLGVNFLGQM